MDSPSILPRISGISGKVMALQRRRDYLAKQVTENRGSSGALMFAKTEMEALDSAVDALTFHRATVERLDTPLTILQEMTEASSTKEGAPPELIAKAQVVLDEYGS